MSKPSLRFEPIAIVGMGALLPGAPNAESFWHNIINKIDAARDVPDGRWPVPPESLFDPRPGTLDRVYSLRGCFLDEIPEFNISDGSLDRDLIGRLDPVFKLALHASQKALADAGTAALDRDRTGVIMANIVLPTSATSRATEKYFVNLLEQQFLERGARRAPRNSPQQAMDRHAAALPAGIVARAFGLGGGCFTLDAACASSLYALKLACDALHAGNTDAVLAGGISRPDCLFTQMGFSQLRALSRRGKSSPFDAAADGLVVGEGAAMFVLKRLEDAERSGDRIHGVIRGIGLSNDRGGSLLAPDTEGQLRAMRMAYAQADLPPDSIDLVECHATGTPVGDAMEIQSLKTLWGNLGWRRNQCPLGSVKSNIGHLLTAAGAAALTKVLLAFRNRTLPPTNNFERTAPGMELEASPFRIQREAQPWNRREAEIPRRAAVSAFGFGGINAHVLVEEYDPACTRVQNETILVSIPGEHDTKEDRKPSIAIVGMEACFGHWGSLRRFQENVFAPSGAHEAATDIPIETISSATNQFKIPPNELKEMLPQQLLMLQVVSRAIEDAGGLNEDELDRTGVLIGATLDLNTTNYHLRWCSSSIARETNQNLELGLDRGAEEQLAASIRESAGPALTANRTVGGLGGMIASRVAREFKLGGPSFTVSSEETSGLTALEIAVGALRRNEIDCAIVGAVDLGCDPRVIGPAELLHSDDRKFSEGAGAIILKRVDDAIREESRIYCLVQATGRSSRTDALLPAPIFDSETLGYVELSVGETEGMPDSSLIHQLAARTDSCAVGVTDSGLGRTGCASGLASLIKAALCVYHQMLPPSAMPIESQASNATFPPAIHFPHRAQAWLRNRCEGPRKAAVICRGLDGSLAHVVLEGVKSADFSSSAREKIALETRNPLGPRGEALLTLKADDPAELIDLLARLRTNVGDFTRSKLDSIHSLAREWWNSVGALHTGKIGMGIVAKDIRVLNWQIDLAEKSIRENPNRKLEGLQGVFYSPNPLAAEGHTAFVFPGSGNSFPGMGCEISALFPEIVRRLDWENARLRDQLAPGLTFPQRANWGEDWHEDARRRLYDDHQALIISHVAYGTMMSEVVRAFAVEPKAVVSYSLGESTGYFALRAWKGRDDMLDRIARSTLFKSDLVGDCLAARELWKLEPNENVEWRVGLIDRSAEIVRAMLPASSRVYLLIVNAPDECVIGGDAHAVEQFVGRLKCSFIPLPGVSTVHCEIAKKFAKEYHDLHLFETNAPAGVRFYSGAWGRSFELNRESAADSILAQAVGGIDFPKTVESAYADGARIFVELGPRNSCSRMIAKILGNRPHMARSVCVPGQNSFPSLLRTLAQLVAEGVPVDLAPLYASPDSACEPTPEEVADEKLIHVPVHPSFGAIETPHVVVARNPECVGLMPADPILAKQSTDDETAVEELVAGTISTIPSAILRTRNEAAQAHAAYLKFSQTMTAAQTKALNLQFELLKRINPDELGDSHFPIAAESQSPPPMFSRELCIEFAIGLIGRVLGPEFSSIDAHPTRVRLPDEPLMFVDRITAIEGEMGRIGPGRVVTEHDVLPGAWYLDADRIPPGFSIEAGQADLFLSAYLGIDFKTKGIAKYRLLDATVTFHRGLPRPNQTITYDIRIDRFIRQGETHLFFFQFDGLVDGQPLLSMRNGCAGFFTNEQLNSGRGVVLTEAEHAARKARGAGELPFWVPVGNENFSAEALESLRAGNLTGCFGPGFINAAISNPVTIPGGKMKLLDRITRFEPRGGAFGLGLIKAEIDIHPDDWFLTCHFTDDPVMPGTLMYESCLHALRVFLLRVGWLGESGEVAYEPVPGVASKMRCRGQVTPETRTAAYEIEIKELAYGPEPYAIADAMMYADGHPIVYITDMSIKLSGSSRERLAAIWPGRISDSKASGKAPETKIDFESSLEEGPKPALVTHERILEFTRGKPSVAYGDRYRVFDDGRFIARLPAPPYLFIDRITHIAATPWRLEAGGWVETQYDVPKDAWYFRANCQPCIPYSALLEVALQSCGWLAAYSGSALRSDQDLHFRNLDGQATLHEDVGPGAGTLTTHAKLVSVSQASGMILQRFQFKLFRAGRLIFEGETSFGFFTKPSLAQQAGLRDPALHGAEDELKLSVTARLEDKPPRTPDDPSTSSSFAPIPAGSCLMPARAYRMIDSVDSFIRGGGMHGLGYIRGSKLVNPADWFFAAHFYQDPVWPGSLGLEAFLQLLKYVALDRWGGELSVTDRFAPITLGVRHSWSYRGQIVPTRREVTVEAAITSASDSDRVILADGVLKVDGLAIYSIKNFGIQIVGERN